jgi:hypothetical protein
VDEHFGEGRLYLGVWAMTGLDRLPRLTADHSVGAPISRDDLWWLIAQVYQLRAQLASEEDAPADPLAGVAEQCNHWTTLADGGSRCTYTIGHPGVCSFREQVRCASYRDDPCFTRCVFNAGHTGTHSYEHEQCIPPNTEGLRECTFLPGHHSPHSFEADAMDIRPATSGPRKCGTREGDRRCWREYDHTGPCML